MQSIHRDTMSTLGVANFSSRDIPLISFVSITSPCDLGKHVVTIAAIRGRERPVGVRAHAEPSAGPAGASPSADTVCPGGRFVLTWVRIVRKRWSSWSLARADRCMRPPVRVSGVHSVGALIGRNVMNLSTRAQAQRLPRCTATGGSRRATDAQLKADSLLANERRTVRSIQFLYI
jgi:hypothetical protein